MEMVPPEQEPLPSRSAPTEEGILGKLDRYVVFLTMVLLWIAGAGLVGMLLLIVADVIGIKIFSSPVPGGTEIVTFLAVITIAFAISHTQAMRGHVAVDFIVEKFPRRAKLIIDVVTVLFSVCLFAVMAVYTFKYGMKLKQTGEVSMTQKIPFYPFIHSMGACFVVMTLLLIRDLIKSIAKAAKTWTR